MDAVCDGGVIYMYILGLALSLAFQTTFICLHIPKHYAHHVRSPCAQPHALKID